MRLIVDDVIFSLRLLRKTPYFTVACIFVLALAVGTASTVFSVLNSFLFDAPQHISDPQSILVLKGSGITWSDYQRVAENIHSMSVAARSGKTERTFGSGPAESATVDFVTPSYFSVLGVTAFIGRVLEPVDDNPLTGGRVVVLSHRFSRRHFGNGTSALGQTIIVSNRRYTVIGVTPEHFTGVDLEMIDLWLPSTSRPDTETDNWVRLVGRLTAGATLDQARGELASFYPGSYHHMDMSGTLVAIASQIPLTRMDEDPLTRMKKMDAPLACMAATGFILLVIACANLASLLLNRSFARRIEIAIRIQLGSSRTRIIRQACCETLVLAAVASLPAMLILCWSTPILRSFVLLPNGDQNLFSAIAILLPAGLTFFCAGCATIPVVAFLGKIGCGQDLRPKSSVDGTGSKIRTVLLVGQVSFAAMVMVGATLLTASLYHTMNLPFGVNAENVLVAVADLQHSGHSRTALKDISERMIDVARGHTDVRLASPTFMPPYGAQYLTDWGAPGCESPYYTPAKPTAPANPFADAISPEYFELLGMRILQGRGFVKSDTRGSPLVAIVNNKMASDIWKQDNPIGKCLVVGHSTKCRQIVGIVSAVRAFVKRDPLHNPDEVDPGFYVPYEQWDSPLPWRLGLLMGTRASVASIVSIRASLQTAAPNLPLVSVDRLASFWRETRK